MIGISDFLICLGAEKLVISLPVSCVSMDLTYLIRTTLFEKGGGLSSDRLIGPISRLIGMESDAHVCMVSAEAKQWPLANRVINEMHSVVKDWDIKLYNSLLSVAARQVDADRGLQVRIDEV